MTDFLTWISILLGLLRVEDGHCFYQFVFEKIRLPKTISFKHHVDAITY